MTIKYTSIAHYMFGFVAALVSFRNPLLGAVLVFLFVVYEVDEDWHLHDRAFRDIREALIGMVIGSVVGMVLWPP